MAEDEAEVWYWLGFAVARVTEYLDTQTDRRGGTAVVFGRQQGEFSKRGRALWQRHYGLVADSLRRRGYRVNLIPLSKALRIH